MNTAIKIIRESDEMPVADCKGFYAPPMIGRNRPRTGGIELRAVPFINVRVYIYISAVLLIRNRQKMFAVNCEMFRFASVIPSNVLENRGIKLRPVPLKYTRIQVARMLGDRQVVFAGDRKKFAVQRPGIAESLKRRRIKPGSVPFVNMRSKIGRRTIMVIRDNQIVFPRDHKIFPIVSAIRRERLKFNETLSIPT